jgi:DNA-binding NarL/FixJ family response regulator
VTAVTSTRPGTPGRPLTLRQQQVLTLAAIGHTNKEIGAKLGVSADAVKTHIERILVALGAKDRTHAAVLAVHRRLLPDLELT